MPGRDRYGTLLHGGLVSSRQVTSKSFGEPEIKKIKNHMVIHFLRSIQINTLQRNPDWETSLEIQKPWKKNRKLVLRIQISMDPDPHQI